MPRLGTMQKAPLREVGGQRGVPPIRPVDTSGLGVAANVLNAMQQNIDETELERKKSYSSSQLIKFRTSLNQVAQDVKENPGNYQEGKVQDFIDSSIGEYSEGIDPSMAEDFNNKAAYHASIVGAKMDNTVHNFVVDESNNILVDNIKTSLDVDDMFLDIQEQVNKGYVKDSDVPKYLKLGADRIKVMVSEL